MPVMLASSFFLKDILYTCSDSKGYGSTAAAVYQRSPERTHEQLAAIFGKQADYLVRLLETQDFDLLKHKTPKLRRALLILQMLKSPHRVLKNKIKRIIVHCRRLWNRPGIFVVVLGLDGAGKSTLIELVRHDFDRLMHTKIKIQHSRPNLLPPLAKLFGQERKQTGPFTNPHAKKPSNMLISILRLAYYTVDYLTGYWFRVYPQLLKFSSVFIFDRYFYDFLADPARYRLSLPNGVLRLFESIVPKPDLVILLEIDPEIAYKRKPHLPLKELREQSARFADLTKKLKAVEVIDSSSPIEHCRKEMLNVLLRTFMRRPRWK